MQVSRIVQFKVRTKLVDAKVVQFCRHAIKQVLLSSISIETGPKGMELC